MSERRQRAATLVAACLLAACTSMPAVAQQGAPPPAVLVQPAELKPIAAQAEFIGRAAAVDKVELHARVKGFLGPRKFSDGDEVKQDQVLFIFQSLGTPSNTAWAPVRRDWTSARLIALSGKPAARTGSR